MNDTSQPMNESRLPFNLARFFSYVSLVLILISSFILALFIGRTMISTVLSSQQEYALLLADNMNRQIFRKFTLPVAYASGRVALADPAQYKLLDDVIKSQLHGLQLETIRLFDNHDAVLYSTAAGEVRRTDLATEGVSLVFKGKDHHFDVISSLPYARAIIAPSIKDGSFLLRTVFPLTVDTDFKSIRFFENPGTVLGVLEIVQDITPQYRKTIQAQRIMLGAFLLSTLVLFLLLNFVARKAEYNLSRRIEHSRSLEAQLHQNEKLASMGRMVASIAHEIRNPLGIIRSTAEFLIRRHKSEDSATQAMLTAIYDESCRLGSTVNDFLDYARPRDPRRENVCALDVIRKAMAFLGQEFERHGITVLTDDLAPDVFIQGDPDLLYRAFYNILANAQQAITGTGKIFISGTTNPDGSTDIFFRDTGPGFTDDALIKARDPFFTTKDNGTGLGLPIVQSITESHGGKLNLANAKDGGAEISLHFPSLPQTSLTGNNND
ncbi:MAG: two-component sensor histidine kinase [Mailhella sp.]|nr:two-component sensor histidine kinase [Mailhella sp.]